MKIGILGSSGGSAFAAFHDIVDDAYPGDHTFAVATDRPCGLEGVGRERGIPVARLEEPDNDALSAAVLSALSSDRAPDLVILYFTRLVGPALYDRVPTYNIHPSLLPAFPGLNALERTLAGGASSFGATLHRVDGTVDGGPIVAQIASPVPPDATLDTLRHLSYLHKVYCALVLVDLQRRSFEGARELVDPRLVERFRALQRREHAAVIP